MKRILYIFIGLLFSLTSCNDWLDVELDNKVDDDKLFSTAEGFKEALAGVYSEMSKSGMYGGRLTMEYVDALAQYYSSNSTYQYWVDYDYHGLITHYSSTRAIDLQSLKDEYQHLLSLSKEEVTKDSPFIGQTDISGTLLSLSLIHI